MDDLDLTQVCRDRADRIDLWASFLNEIDARSMVEVGVWRGEFAAEMLSRCPGIDTYYMIDPWRHLDAWNKPANAPDVMFEDIMAEALERTRFAGDRVKVLRGRTREVIDEIPDGGVDFAYVDGDHSLRGITVDLQLVLPKVRPDGWVGGDDFSPTVWQHPANYEPTFVFPYAVYFAEAMGLSISALDFNQFLMQRRPASGPVFSDLTGRYPDPSVKAALVRSPDAEHGPAPGGLRGRVSRSLAALRGAR